METQLLIAAIGAGLVSAAILAAFIRYLLHVTRRNEMQTAGNAPAPERTERPRSGGNGAALTVAPAIPASQPDAPAGPEILPFGIVRKHLQRAVHLMIVGETDSGKSTSTRAVMADRIDAGETIIVLDPHSSPTTWAGLRAVGAGRDFGAIDLVMEQLLAEMTKRYGRIANEAGYTPEALTIFVDEWPAIQTNCKQAKRFMTELAQEGRKAGMRLVILTQSDLVASLGIEGKGDVRSNFLMLLLGTKAIARCAESLAMIRPAALRRGEGAARAASTEGMKDVSDALDTSRATIWRAASDRLPLPMKAPPVSDAEPALDPLWEKFLSGADLLEPETITGDSAGRGAENGQKLVIEPVIENADLADTYQQKPVIENLPKDELSQAIRLLVMGGISRNKTIQLLSLPGVRADQLKRIKAALGEVDL